MTPDQLAHLEADTSAELQRLDEDVNLALAWLIAHQDEWGPEMCIARSGVHTTTGRVIASNEAVLVPVTLIGVVRS